MIQQVVLIALSNHPFVVGVKAIFTANHFPLKLAHPRQWFSGKFLFFVITCESVGTVDSMCLSWQQQSAQG